MTNPLIAPWDGPFGLPRFDLIEEAHFRPAFDAALAEQEAEFEAIATNPEAPDFANTIEALERSGRLLSRVGAVFWNRAGSDTNDEIQAIEREIGPRLSQHFARQLTDQRVFTRIEAVVAEPGDLTSEQARVLERAHKRRVRAGARLDDAGRARMQEIMRRLSELGTAFSQNVLKDEAAWTLELGPDDLAGLPESFVEAARSEAGRRGRPGYVVTLSRSSVEPFLALSARRDLREAAFRAWAARGEAKNWPLVAETVRLRAERARLLGYQTFARFKLDDEMAASPDRARDLLMAVWGPARRRAAEEARALQALAAEEGANIELAPWDWRYYAEKLRKRLHDLDEAEMKPYLALDNVIAAAFDVAERLFGLRFTPVDAPVPHPDARAWEVTRDGAHVGLFIGDYFARPSKRSGAWASGLRGQQKLWEPGRPVVLNTCNFAPGNPPLLGWDDAQTLFHEFGHALHGLMSDVTYPSIAGTSVARDFVELPSQLFEHWLSLPEVLEAHARHHRTGAWMPHALVERIEAASTFNQGFKTVEYVASALVDLEMHEIEDRPGFDWADFDAAAFEAAVLRRIGMPEAIVMRHRTPHFSHVFSGDGYSAGYYSYMWSEVLDADAFRAFEETGDPFDRATADRLARHVLSAGGREKPEDAWAAFRGRIPGVEALLDGRGLVPEPAPA
jgi:peptidyl-dipeptidase Dcp